jgi:hypothetical protein
MDIRAVRRRASFVPNSACHTGGLGCESRRSGPRFAGLYALRLHDRPQGALDTNLKGVSLRQLRPATAVRHPRRRQKSQNGPCWTTFGGNPARTLARAQVHLGRPGVSVWAHALDGYIEFPPTYCNGRLYVNNYHGTTYAVNADTGKILWRWRGGGHKPSATAIDGPRLFVPADRVCRPS